MKEDERVGVNVKGHCDRFAGLRLVGTQPASEDADAARVGEGLYAYPIDESLVRPRQLWEGLPHGEGVRHLAKTAASD